MTETAQQHQHGYIHRKDDYVKRLRRIEGQARGLQRMVEEEKYCIDILTQISAVSTALESVALRILDAHVNHCVAGALAAGDAEDARIKTEELMQAVERFAKAR